MPKPARTVARRKQRPTRWTTKKGHSQTQQQMLQLLLLFALLLLLIGCAGDTGPIIAVGSQSVCHVVRVIYNVTLTACGFGVLLSDSVLL
jgi:hypothetical protein